MQSIRCMSQRNYMQGQSWNPVRICFYEHICLLLCQDMAPHHPDQLSERSHVLVVRTLWNETVTHWATRSQYWAVLDSYKEAQLISKLLLPQFCSIPYFYFKLEMVSIEQPIKRKYSPLPIPPQLFEPFNPENFAQLGQKACFSCQLSK